MFRGGCGAIRRRDESGTVSKAGRTNKKPRTLTSHDENEPPQLKLHDSMQSPPQARLTLHDASAKNFQPSSPNASSSITRSEIHVEEICPIDVASKKEVVEESSMDSVIGFIDEEEMFNMPGLVNNMAEGMLLTPPAMKRGFKWSHDIDDTSYIDLWGE